MNSMDWQIIPGNELSGRIAVPGSKSHTIRAVIAGLLSRGCSEIYAPLYSADTRSALSAAAALGAKIDESREVWKISGCGKDFASPELPVDLGNSGTTMRIITAAAALGRGEISFDGDASLRTRIMQGLLDALADLGADCRSCNGFAPLPKSMFDLKAWHISDLVVYEQPRELSAFYKHGTLSATDWEYQLYDGSGDPSRSSYASYLFTRAIRKPPQSWCYVEALN